MSRIVLPNVRKLFIPDPGYMIFDCDLKGADAQVVAWEAEDEDLKAAFRQGLDIHVKNATDMLGERFTSLKPETFPWKKLRKQNKTAVHLTNYGGQPMTMTRNPIIGWPLNESERFQRKWFELHPGVHHWHKRTADELHKTRSVSNRFGYRRIYFDRIDGLLPQALAWGPQSTVAEVTFRGALKLEKHCPWVEMLIQVHDSLVFQVPFVHCDKLDRIKEGLEVVVPYPDPLIIPWSIARSEKSWGECEKVAA